MNKTKIDWCDSTWNPVTGCLHGCEYCYARGIAERFGGLEYGMPKHRMGRNHILTVPMCHETKSGNAIAAAYPFGFDPTLYKYRLGDYIGKKGRNIFVCSMADLFGSWVPDIWIEEIFKACGKAPQHNYMFLTKNPYRYIELTEKGILKSENNMWYGWSETSESNRPGPMYFSDALSKPLKTFVSVEPILDQVHPSLGDWIIVGAETGRRKDKVVPKREWIEQIVEDCRKYDIPLFMKSSLAEIWGEPLIQEFPAALKEMEEGQA